MAEQFAFKKVVGNGAAVDRYELVVDAGDGSGNQFLTDAGFALDQYGAGVDNGAFYGFAQLLHGIAVSYQMAHAFAKDFAGVVDFL